MVPRSGGEIPEALHPPLTNQLQLQSKAEAIAHHAAATHKEIAVRLGQVQRQQDHLAVQTSKHLQAHHERQTALIEQQQEMRKRMDEQRKNFERWLESLAEAVHTHLQARWGISLKVSSITDNHSHPSPATVTTGTNMPTPSIYLGD
ncbi:Hypothetical protein PHPALM_11709 [Phytophthora palmivora]|uniref:Uncharacterized protein n=1 Tax=Phytophthora palmivora TaxID=4796 RepID=A0A2P4Y1K6_9STRA|nr:Hypothetical protein PHPALM_11709 [Phytophthora palmivora]